uniref:Uncharacterized protein n=1 Tax=Periophthalmus magnuspinnatus TaxID=409849 RepID=A0A3B4BB58_9GOBI
MHIKNVKPTEDVLKCCTIMYECDVFFLYRIHVITWNVGSAQPPDDITSLLGLNVGDGNTDMYIIG